MCDTSTRFVFTYYVLDTNRSGCVDILVKDCGGNDTTVTLCYTPWPSAIDESPISPALVLSAHPNPAHNELRVQLSGTIGFTVFELFNEFGQRVIHASGEESENTSLDVSSLHSGMYLLSVHNGLQSSLQRVLIAR